MHVPIWLIEKLENQFILFSNHILATEPLAMARLQSHANRFIACQFQGPQWLSFRPSLVCVITPAGLLERTCPIDIIDLTITFDVLWFLDFFKGYKPTMQSHMTLSGDAQLASDMAWLADHIQWDVEDDLAQLMGPIAAREVARIGSKALSILSRGAQLLGTFASYAKSSQSAKS